VNDAVFGYVIVHMNNLDGEEIEELKYILAVLFEKSSSSFIDTSTFMEIAKGFPAQVVYGDVLEAIERDRITNSITVSQADLCEKVVLGDQASLHQQKLNGYKLFVNLNNSFS
jgi:hypothetical protein